MTKKVINLFRDHIVPNPGKKYATLLEEFIVPFQEDFKHFKYVEDIFGFAICAWNFGNLKRIMPKEEFKKIYSKPYDSADLDLHLLKKMVNLKGEKFNEYSNFIIDFELEQTAQGENPILIVTTQEEDDYLAGMLETIEESLNYSQDDFQENYINRKAIVLKPKQPLLDWISNLLPQNVYEEEVQATNIYLIDDDIDDPEEWLKRRFDNFFSMELGDWHTNKKEWPQKRTYKMFEQWFHIEISEMIYDLERRPVSKEE